jgi:hypothetical protein
LVEPNTPKLPAGMGMVVDSTPFRRGRPSSRLLDPAVSDFAPRYMVFWANCGEFRPGWPALWGRRHGERMLAHA